MKIRDGFLCCTVDLMDFRLRLDRLDGKSCRKAFFSLRRMNPDEWTLSLDVEYNRPDIVTLRLTGDEGCFALRQVPTRYLKSDLRTGYRIAKKHLYRLDHDFVMSLLNGSKWKNTDG